GTPFVFHCEIAAAVFPKCWASSAALPFSASSQEMKFMLESLGDAKPFGQASSKPTMFSIPFMGNVRRARFVAWFQGPPCHGDRGALVRLMTRVAPHEKPLTKGRLSQLFDEDEPFGETAARNLAIRLGLPEDFFENDR